MEMVIKRKTAILIFFLFGFVSGLVMAEEAVTYHMNRATQKISIDGYLSEKVWEDALIVPLSYEIVPGENAEPPVKTQCYLLYDDTNLYVGFKSYDPNPDQIRAHLSDRDNSFSDDLVAIFLDTFNDENRAFGFLCNPLGVQIDEIFSNGGANEDLSWDAIWDSAGHINEKGFEVEILIPFRILQFQRSKENQTWGFALLRNYPRSQLHQITNFPHNRSNACFLCQFPKLEGIAGVSPGKNIELDPTFTALRTDARKNFPEGSLEKLDSQVEVGISGKWGFSPNMNLSATVNPDFSQVEADSAQLDINTQFALYYDERRPFFLEGLDFFTTHINGVYTRTLADPSWGVKVSGKEKRNAIGFFISRDEITNFLFPGAEVSQNATLDQGATATVLRYRRDIGSSSTLGFLITDREGKDYYNRLAGVDGLLRLGKSDTIRFQLLGSSTRYPSDIAKEFQQDTGNMNGYAGYFSYQRRTRGYSWKLSYEDYSPKFRADLGFIPQVDYRKGTVGAGYIYWGKNRQFVNYFEARGEVNRCEDHQGDLLEQEAKFSMEMEMPLQTLLIVTATTEKKNYRTVSFQQNFLDIYMKSRPSGGLSLNCSLQLGDEIDYNHTREGKLFAVAPKINLNFNKHISTSLSYSYSHLNVEGGRLYRAHLIQTWLMYHFSKRAFFRGILQYTDIRRNISLYSYEEEPKFLKLFTQLLFSYKLNPRTVLFLGYSDFYNGYIDIPLKQLNHTFFLKIGYALSF